MGVGRAGPNEVDRFVSRFLMDQNQGVDDATRGLRRIHKHRECRGIRRKVLNFSSRLSSRHLEVYIEEGVTEFSNLETRYSLYSRVLVFFDHVSSMAFDSVYRVHDFRGKPSGVIGIKQGITFD